MVFNSPIKISTFYFNITLKSCQRIMLLIGRHLTGRIKRYKIFSGGIAMKATVKQYEKYTEDFCKFAHSSPDPFHAADNVKNELEKQGFIRLYETEEWELSPGKGYFFIRNGCSLVAFKLPKDDFCGYNIFSCHGDSPAFKIKENPERVCEGAYVTLNVERYGGTVPYLWFDRPLSISGRVFVKEGSTVHSRLVDLKRNLLCIPSIAPHLRSPEEIYSKVKIQKEIQPLISSDKDFSVKKLVANELGVKEQDIVSHDLYLTPFEQGIIFGQNREFFSSPRIDDLLCAFAGLSGFLKSKNSPSAGVFALFDNEEVGSGTRQGALSDMLRLTFERISLCLKRTKDRPCADLANSFMVSADNGHALHPGFPEKSDPTNRPTLGGGILIKHSANQKYTTDGLSAAIFKTILQKAEIPFQDYVNHSDIAGGSTLGNLADRQVSVATVDIGAAQLGMHSPLETGSVRDALQLSKAAEAFFNSRIKLKKDGGFSVD